MKRFVLFVITLFTVILTCACDSEQANILFNKHPFTKDTIISQSNTNIFQPGERIYYLIALPEKSESKMLLVQVFKLGGDKDERLGYELVWSKRVKMKQEQVYYYTDYIVLNKTGPYVMKVYSRDNPTKILTSAHFYVKN